MKKTLLSIASALAVMSLNAQVVPNHLGTKACFDDFVDGNADVPGNSEYSALTTLTGWDEVTKAPSATEKAYRGMYWTEAKGEINGFYATKVRNAATNSIDYTITQNQGYYEPFLMVFGSYAEGTTKKEFTIDLSSDANVSFDVTNGGDKAIKFTVQLQDINNKSLVYLPSVVGEADEYKHNIGFSQGETAPLAAGATKTFAFDFATAITGCQPGNVVGGEGSCGTAFDLSKVKAITFTAVNDLNTPAYAPLTIADYKMSIKNFKMGNQATVGISKKSNVASFAVYPNPVSGTATFSEELTNVTVYDFTGNVVATEASASSLNTTDLQAGMYMISSDQGTTKIVVE